MSTAEREEPRLQRWAPASWSILTVVVGILVLIDRSGIWQAVMIAMSVVSALVVLIYVAIALYDWLRPKWNSARPRPVRTNLDLAANNALGALFIGSLVINSRPSENLQVALEIIGIIVLALIFGIAGPFLSKHLASWRQKRRRLPNS